MGVGETDVWMYLVLKNPTLQLCSHFEFTCIFLRRWSITFIRFLKSCVILQHLKLYSNRLAVYTGSKISPPPGLLQIRRPWKPACLFCHSNRPICLESTEAILIVPFLAVYATAHVCQGALHLPHCNPISSVSAPTLPQFFIHSPVLSGN